jgi:hypothetical protein
VSAPSTVQWLRAAAARVYTGSGRLATHYAGRLVAFGRRRYEAVAAWVGRSSGVWWLAKVALLLWLAGRARLVVTAVVERVLERVDSGAFGWLLWTLAGLWVVGAYRAGADGWEPKQRPVPEAVEAESEEPAVSAESVSAVSLVKPPPVSPTALVAAVRDIGTPHAQLKPLAEHLGVSTDAVRAAAAGIGWPVKDVRMEGRSSSAGLRWDDCPSPTILAPSPGVVGAGQPADDNDDDTSGEGPGKRFRVVPIGLSGTVVHDPAETIRHHRVRGQ